MENRGANGLIGVLIILLIWSFFFYGKYEGRNAEEWFNAYDETEARLETTRTKYEEFVSTMENETALKKCIERDDELTRKVINSLCNQNINGCLQDRTKVYAFDIIMKSNKEGKYKCVQEYIDN